MGSAPWSVSAFIRNPNPNLNSLQRMPSYQYKEDQIFRNTYKQERPPLSQTSFFNQPPQFQPVSINSYSWRNQPQVSIRQNEIGLKNPHAPLTRQFVRLTQQPSTQFEQQVTRPITFVEQTPNEAEIPPASTSTESQQDNPIKRKRGRPGQLADEDAENKVRQKIEEEQQEYKKKEAAQIEKEAAIKIVQNEIKELEENMKKLKQEAIDAPRRSKALITAEQKDIACELAQKNEDLKRLNAEVEEISKQLTHLQAQTEQKKYRLNKNIGTSVVLNMLIKELTDIQIATLTLKVNSTFGNQDKLTEYRKREMKFQSKSKTQLMDLLEVVAKKGKLPANNEKSEKKK